MIVLFMHRVLMFANETISDASIYWPRDVFLALMVDCCWHLLRFYMNYHCKAAIEIGHHDEEWHLFFHLFFE